MDYFVYEVSSSTGQSRVVTTAPSEQFWTGQPGVELRLVGVFPDRQIAELVRDETEARIETNELR